MLVLPSLSKLPMSFKYCFSKPHLLTSLLGYGEQLLVTRSIHSLQFGPCSILKPCGLLPNIVFTRFRSRFAPKRKRVDPPTDFLPFQWTRKKINDEIETSGDHIRTVEVDPSLPKFGLELAETLKDLDDVVRKQFTLEVSDTRDQIAVYEEIMLKKVQQHPMDFDSWEVKIGLETVRILSLLQHFKRIPKETRGKVILIHAIHKRNKMLKELRKIDMPRFEWLVKELNIEFTPAPLHVQKVRYTRKNELRRLTKEYCEKLVSEKRAAYHAELKKQQELFLKEKEEILAWIAAEEKDMGIAKTDNVPNS